MVKITNIRVHDLEESIIASGYPMLVKQPSIVDIDINTGVVKMEFGVDEDNKHISRAFRLAPLGGGHNNFLKGIRVSFDIRYPQYFSPELQRYNFVDIVSSSSKMHSLGKMQADECCNEWVTEETKVTLQALIDAYNYLPNYENWMRLLSNAPLGIELFMRCSTNYLQLRTIYHQRKHHKLRNDWGAFCEFIEGLPYAKELIINTKEDRKK